MESGVFDSLDELIDADPRGIERHPASLSRKLTSARCTPMSPSRARLTATGQAPQVIPSTESTIVDACAASTTCATNSRTTRPIQNPCPRFMSSPPAHSLHVVPSCAVTARVT